MISKLVTELRLPAEVVLRKTQAARVQRGKQKPGNRRLQTAGAR
jgi:hypothetical protein